MSPRSPRSTRPSRWAGPRTRAPSSTSSSSWPRPTAHGSCWPAARRLEEAAHRVRTVRFGPRTLDADVLLVGDLVVDEPDLVVPHPRMWERRFVLAPLADLAPDLVPEDRLIAAGGKVVRTGRICSRTLFRSSVGERHPQGAGTPKEVSCNPSVSSAPGGPVPHSRPRSAPKGGTSSASSVVTTTSAAAARGVDILVIATPDDAVALTAAAGGARGRHDGAPPLRFLRARRPGAASAPGRPAPAGAPAQCRRRRHPARPPG